VGSSLNLQHHLGKFEAVFEVALGHESGAQVGWFTEASSNQKNIGQVYL
jgi:hypothetical protein